MRREAMASQDAEPGIDPATGTPLPPRDPFLARDDLDVDALAGHWASQAAMRPMSAEEMRGADARAQRLGVAGSALMEAAGVAVAAAARALLRTSERPASSPVLILCGPGNNGGDGLVAARHLADAGLRSVVVLVAGPLRPETPDAARNWDRLDALGARAGAAGPAPVERIHAPSARDVALLHNGIERAALVIDALLGTGVSGTLREPVRTAVDVIVRARAQGVPVLAVDTPTALDLTSGEPSDPVVRADVTVTFHRPKHGLLAPVGRTLAGRVLVAPIGIPLEADRG
jgi:ADP-dependent NAD(P)H-hydrate dehydratase / NAD(P)H-hydrate epimerase